MSHTSIRWSSLGRRHMLRPPHLNEKTNEERRSLSCSEAGGLRNISLLPGRKESVELQLHWKDRRSVGVFSNQAHCFPRPLDKPPTNEVPPPLPHSLVAVFLIEGKSPVTHVNWAQVTMDLTRQSLPVSRRGVVRSLQSIPCCLL